MATIGYVDTVSLCHQVKGIKGKRLTDWRKRLDVQAFLQAHANQLGVAILGDYGSGALIEYKTGHSCRAYLHPSVASKYADYLVSTKRKSAVVYIIHAEGTNYYKIGITVDVPARLSQLQIASPHLLRLHKVIDSKDPESKELEMHAKLDKYRVRGEWFELSPKQVERL